MFNLELRARLPEGFSLTGFYDHGTVRVNHDNAVGTNPNTITLKGTGLSLTWQSSVGLNLKATWSHRIGENPNPTSTGNDQDGTKIRNRLWLTALLTF